MKITTALCAATLGSAALGVPVASMLDHQHQEAVVSSKQHSVASYIESSARRFHLPFSLSFLGHSKPSPKGLSESSSLEDTLSFLDDSEVSEVLTAPRPLATAYLMSLKPTPKPKAKPQTKAKPKAKQHSQTPVSGQEQSSTVQAETGSLAGSNPSTIEAETAASKPIYRYLPCQTHGGPRHYHLARQYADMVVVGVLIAFVALVILVELWSPISQRYV